MLRSKIPIRETQCDKDAIAGQKPYRHSACGKLVFQPSSSDAPAWPETILSGHVEFMITLSHREGARSAPASHGSSTASIPRDGHPTPGHGAAMAMHGRCLTLSKAI